MHPEIDTWWSFYNKSTTFISAVISNQEISCSLSKDPTTRVQRDHSSEGTLRLDLSTKVLFRGEKNHYLCAHKKCLKNTNQSLSVWTNNWRCCFSEETNKSIHPFLFSSGPPGETSARPAGFNVSAKHRYVQGGHYDRVTAEDILYKYVWRHFQPS